MQRLIWQDNRELLQKLIEAYEPGDFILTPSKRLASLIRHTYRNFMIEKKEAGWEIPRVLSLASWLNEISLMSSIPYVASKYLRWKIFNDLVNSFPPPPPFRPGIALARSMDAALSSLIRHKIKWDDRECNDRLYEWRNDLFGRFLEILRSENMIHPEEVPLLACNSDILDYFPVRRVHLVMLDTPSPSEQELLDYISGRVESVYWGIDEDYSRKGVTRVAFESPEEEVRWVLEDVLEASREFPLHSLGIVMMDPDFQMPLFKNYLESIIGKAATESSGSFNITLSGYLSDTALFKASMLPLRFWLQQEDRSLLLSLLLSTYYGLWRGKRDKISLLDKALRDKNCHRNVFACFEGFLSDETFNQVLSPGLWIDLLKRIRTFEGSCENWFLLLDRFWDSSDFPVVSDEVDELSRRHYNELRTSLIQGLGDTKLNLEKFYSWIKTAASETRISPVGYETAGIQLLSPLDARGLLFNRMWLVGVTGNTFPQPPRDIPLVSPTEAKYIQGCSSESQWVFARKLFPRLLTCAPEPVMTRHSFTEGESVPPSPFWGGEEMSMIYDPWKSKKGWWVRSNIYRQALSGAATPGRWELPENIIEPFPDPGEISVSDLSTILSCPFKFLMENVFQVEPLKEEPAGIHPIERGLLLHRVLERFVKRVISGSISLDSEEALDLLVELSEEIIAGIDSSPFYRLELKRWLDREKGLLVKWLEVERQRSKQGFVWQMAEIPFSGLKIEKIRLRGRIDRIDTKDEATLMCLEYKTGMLPSPKSVFDHMTQPQLPAYLLAIKDGLVKGRKGYRSGRQEAENFLAGYVTLKKAGEVEIKEYKPRKESWKDFISRWKQWVLVRTQPVINGRYPAAPVPSPEENGNSPCGFCDYKLVCNRGLAFGEENT